MRISLFVLLVCASCDDGNGGLPPGDGTPDLAAADDGGDGPATRQACTGTFGNALSKTHGRLDGYLVSTVPVDMGGCNGDHSHVHLQVQLQGAVYDVAVTMLDNSGGDVLFAERDIPLPDGAWAEGWHTGQALDYPTLGLHAADFTAMSESSLAQKVLGELASANHVSIFATGYGTGGAHLVHRNGGGNDGAIVIDPLAPTAHAMFFHFATQTF
jgi:hypothetical protein